MYLFLFQAPKHTNSYAYYRYKKSNTRGEFDLSSLRKATKGNVKIWGHGTHPIFQILQDHGLSHIFRGHILEVTDPKVAVWVKLNYDLLGKKGVKYAGGFKDLDLEVMRDLNKKITAIDLERKELLSHQHPVNNVVSMLNRLITNCGADNSHPFVSKDTAKMSRDLQSLISRDLNARSGEILDLTTNLTFAKNDLEHYVKSCGMDPGSR